MDIATVKGFKSPVARYPKRRVGEAEILHFTRQPDDVFWGEGVRGITFFRYGKRARLTELRIGGQVWMTDEWPYTTCMESYARRCHGRTLVAGLGLGIVAHFLTRNRDVDVIDIVDRSADVIGLVEPLLPKDGRIRVVHEYFDSFVGDAWRRGERYDSCVWDLAVSGDGREPGENMRLMPAAKATALAMVGVQPERCFVHGIDRDPDGERWIRENREEFKRAKWILEDAMRRRRG